MISCPQTYSGKIRFCESSMASITMRMIQLMVLIQLVLMSLSISAAVAFWLSFKCMGT